jgi:hypothetical protein
MDKIFDTCIDCGYCTSGVSWIPLSTANMRVLTLSSSASFIASLIYGVLVVIEHRKNRNLIGNDLYGEKQYHRDSMSIGSPKASMSSESVPRVP